MKQKIIQILTLLSFAGLISGFVIYRAGILEDIIQLSPNGGAINTAKTNNTSKSDSIKRTSIFSSSKSLILTDPKIPLKYNLQPKPLFDSSSKKKVELMSGSKSVIIYRYKYNSDSLKSKEK